MLNKLIDFCFDQTPKKNFLTKLDFFFLITLLRNLVFTNCDKMEENSKVTNWRRKNVKNSKLTLWPNFKNLNKSNKKNCGKTKKKIITVSKNKHF